ncbi:AMP-binding protein [Paraburkholderia bannensis]|uniref:AMP-binding protein n=1 Tax=Paraburkholderia bannensis TaxID=765414 RepID=UPI000485F743|nr:AMP-binding protein [Paraburkholderia bannensis]
MQQSIFEYPRAPRYRSARVPAWPTTLRTLPDGSLLLSSPAAPAVPQSGFVDSAACWAQQRGTATAFSERDASGAWRSITWAELWRQVRAIAAALLDLGLGPQRPVMLLSGNSIEQALLLLAAEYAGVPTAPVSPACSQAGRDFARLKQLYACVRPAALFVQDRAAHASAIAALGADAAPVIAVNGATASRYAWSTLAATALTPARIAALAGARAAIQPADTLRILFTSGSTGVPKAVVMSHANLREVTAYLAFLFGPLADPQPVFLDWMPWHHTMGGLLGFGRAMVTGASHYLDDGAPQPGRFERTLRNLREISPTMFASAPAAFAMLADALERDDALAQKLFARLVSFGYGGAGLSHDVWARIQRVAERTVGERIAFRTSLGATETNGMGTHLASPGGEPGNVGLPGPGIEARLVPLAGEDGRYELRLRGGSIFSGYHEAPELDAAAFDAERFFRLGDAVRLADPRDPLRGLLYAGRIAEDFKLASGTWVRVGQLRLALLERCSPLLNDAVICGHDRDYVAALAWPNLPALRALAPELDALDAVMLVRHPIVIAQLSELLRSCEQSGASLVVRRVMLLADPPSIDAGEITDKGYLNQAACRAHRAVLVDRLFLDFPEAHIAVIS